MQFDRRWVLPASAFVAFQFAGAIILAVWLDYRQAPPFHYYGILFLDVVMVAGALLVAGHSVAGLDRRPTSRTQALAIGLQGYSKRLPEFAVGSVLCWLQLITLTWYKSMMPLTGPMWADPLLAGLDLALFGTDPGPALQVSLRPWATFFELTYEVSWPLALKLSLIFLFLSPSRTGRHAQLLLTYFLIQGVLGSWGQFLFPSGGPIFWHDLGLGNRFDGMDPPPLVAAARDYLWQKHLGNAADFAGGISAMPSIHVAMAMWMLLVARSIFRKMYRPMIVYFAIISVGSVYTGWHYAVDAIAGALGAVVCYRLAGVIVERIPESWLGQAQPPASEAI